MMISIAVEKDLDGSFHTREIDVGSLKEAFSESPLDRFFVEYGGGFYSFYKGKEKVICNFITSIDSKPKKFTKKVTAESIFNYILKKVSKNL